jgi:hypothetical protein
MEGNQLFVIAQICHTRTQLRNLVIRYVIAVIDFMTVCKKLEHLLELNKEGRCFSNKSGRVGLS